MGRRYFCIWNTKYALCTINHTDKERNCWKLDSYKAKYVLYQLPSHKPQHGDLHKQEERRAYYSSY
jgi:hypothetical protein